MSIRLEFVLAVAAVSTAALLLAGCEDNGVIPSSEATLAITANPLEIVIDTVDGDTSGESEIAVTIQEGSYPQANVRVFFATTSGLLSTVEGDSSLGLPSDGVPTDAQGRAVVFLTLREQDGANAIVTATATNLEGTVTVAKSFNTGNSPPDALAVADPDFQQQVERLINLDGTGSSDRDGDPLTCYEWTIVSQQQGFPPQTSTVVSETTTLSYPRGTCGNGNVCVTLGVTLRVSDDPDDGCDNLNGVPDSFSYEVLCDLTDPEVRPGPDQQLDYSGTPITFTLDGRSSFDSDSTITSYQWTCGGSTAIPTAVAGVSTCEYDEVGSWEAELTVVNGCGLTASDRIDLTLTVPIPGAAR